MPSCRATALAVVQLSPVSMTTRMPSALQRCERLGRGVLDRVGDGEDAGHAPVHADEDRRGALLAQLVGLASAEPLVSTAVFAQEGRIAERDLASVDLADRAFPGRRVEVRDLASDPALLRRRDDGDRQRMLARPLDARSEAQDRPPR